MCIVVFLFLTLIQALLEYEKHKIQTGELKFSMANLPGSMSVDNQVKFHCFSLNVKPVRCKPMDEGILFIHLLFL